MPPRRPLYPPPPQQHGYCTRRLTRGPNLARDGDDVLGVARLLFGRLSGRDERGVDGAGLHGGQQVQQEGAAGKKMSTGDRQYDMVLMAGGDYLIYLSI